MNDIFKEEDTDPLLLVDALNAFNTLNRKVLLHNIKYLCRHMATCQKLLWGTIKAVCGRYVYITW